MSEARPRKIAVIGATGFEYGSPEARVDCFPWNRVRRIGNLADYDEVIIDLLAVQEAQELDGDALEEVLNVRSTYEVLANGQEEGAIYVLGDPRHIVSVEAIMHRPMRAGQDFLSWTGMDFVWDDRPGDAIELQPAADRHPIKAFADSLKRWDYSLSECMVLSQEFADIFDLDVLEQQNLRLEVLLEVFCTTRYGNPLIFSTRLSAADVAYAHPGNRVIHRETLSGPIVFMPKLALSERETIEFILRELCGVDVSAPEPEWVSEFAVPGQERIDRELAELEDRIESLIQEHDRKVEERDEVRKPLKLLYETGTALEEIVWSVLEALGAEVERPEERTNEDGWVTVQVEDQTFEGVLEVKGVKSKHFSLEGLRQLTDWIERGMTLRKKRYHGVFVGNSAIKDPPQRRIWPFHKNWVEQAEMRGYAAIRTEDLYTLYLLDRTGRLDREGFWRELFSTKGPLDMRRYRKKLTDEEQKQLRNLPSE